MQAALCGPKPSDCRGVGALTRGRTSPWPESGWTRTDLYRTRRYRASPHASATVLSPTQPANGTGQPRTGCSSPDIHLGAARLSPNGPAQHVQTQLPTRPRLIADNRIGFLQLTQIMGPGLLPAHQVAGEKTGPQQAFRRVRSFDRDRHDNPNSHPRPGTIKAILGSTSILVQVRQPSTSHLAKLRLGPRIPGSSNSFSLSGLCLLITWRTPTI